MERRKENNSNTFPADRPVRGNPWFIGGDIPPGLAWRYTPKTRSYQTQALSIIEANSSLVYVVVVVPGMVGGVWWWLS